MRFAKAERPRAARAWRRGLSAGRRDFYDRVLDALKRRGTPTPVAEDLARRTVECADESVDLAAVAGELRVDVEELLARPAVFAAPTAPPIGPAANSATRIDRLLSAADHRGGP